MRRPRSPFVSAEQAWLQGAVGVLALAACNTYDTSLLGAPVVVEEPAMNDEPEPDPGNDPLVLPTRPDGEPAAPTSGDGRGGAPSPANGSGGNDAGAPTPSQGGEGGNSPLGQGGAGGGSAAGGAGAGGNQGGEGGLAAAGMGAVAGAAGSGGEVGGGGQGGEPPVAGGGSGGGAGSGGSGGTSPEPFACTGCARLLVPLDAAGDHAHFTIVLAAATNLSAATITLRVAREAGTGGTLRAYVQQGDSQMFMYRLGPGTDIDEIPTAETMDIAWDLADETGFDLATIARIGIEITAEGSTAWTAPTVILLDRITVMGANPAVSAYPFDAATTVHPTPVEIYNAGPIWLNSYSADTTAAGSEISWIGASQ